MEILKEYFLAHVDDYNFFDVMDALGIERESETTLAMLLWEKWVQECLENSEYYTTKDKERRKLFVQYMQKSSFEIIEDEDALATIFSAFVSGVDVALRAISMMNDIENIDKTIRSMNNIDDQKNE